MSLRDTLYETQGKELASLYKLRERLTFEVSELRVIVEHMPLGLTREQLEYMITNMEKLIVKNGGILR